LEIVVSGSYKLFTSKVPHVKEVSVVVGQVNLFVFNVVHVTVVPELVVPVLIVVPEATVTVEPHVTIEADVVPKEIDEAELIVPCVPL